MIDLLPKPAKNGRTPLPVVLLRTPTGTIKKVLLGYSRRPKRFRSKTDVFQIIIDLPLGDEEHSDRKKTKKMKVSYVRGLGMKGRPW